jgi:LPXTG-site transpeptidase (sortase) family protein
MGSRSDRAVGRRSTARTLVWGGALAAVVAGVVLVVIALRGQESAPKPVDAGRINPPAVPSARASNGSSSTPSSPPTVGHASSVPIARSLPTRLQIPAIGVDTPVNALGLNSDGTIAVPQPGPHLNQAAWFQNSPTPGQNGPSIIEGHVDSVEGESVFFRLGAVHPGDVIRVERQDGSTMVFKVNAVRDYLKSKFPTAVVYGGDLSAPTLRLITCSDFDEAIHHHVGNEVVYSHLVRVVHADKS